VAAASLGLALLAGVASAKDEPEFGAAIDAFCTAQGRLPATPYADLRSAIPTTECQLCHKPFTFDKINVLPGFDEWKLATKIARDTGTEPDFSWFCPTLANPNQPPVLDPIPPQSVREGELLALRIRATDPDGHRLAFQATNAPTGSTLSDRGDGTADFRWTPTYQQAGNFEVTFVVTDDGTPPASHSQAVLITVGNVNRPPELGRIGNRSGSEGAPLTFRLTATDPDGDRLSFEGANLPTGASLVDRRDGTADFSWTPTYQQSGNFDVLFRVTDSGVPPESDSEQITITIGNVNREPTLAPVGNRTGSTGSPLTIQLSASDLDGDRLRFDVADAPTGSSFRDRGDGTAEFSWTPSVAGVYPVTFVVTDDGVPIESDSETIRISVGAVNRAPTLDPIGNRSVDEGVLFEIPLTASDPDGDTLRFSATPLPRGAELVNQRMQSALFRWTPGFDQAGNHELLITVTDDGSPMESASERITISVGDVNRPPVLDQIGSRMGQEGMPLSIKLTASDPDGDSLRFATSALPQGATFIDHDDGSAEIGWTPMAGQAGNYPVTVTVRDGGTPSASDFEDFTITVAPADQPPANRLPTLDPVGDRTVKVGEPLAIMLTASDPDGDHLSFAVDGLAPGARFIDRGDGSAEVYWTPGQGDAGEHRVTCSVTDDGTPPESDAERIMVRVEAVGEPPMDPPMEPPTGYLELQRARWSSGGSRLEVRGRTDAYAAVDIVAAGSGELLGSVMADEEGKFALNARPYVVPCAVQARQGDRYTPVVPVEYAPEGCGMPGYTYLRVKEAVWSCEKSELRVHGDHAPGGATLSVREMPSGTPLATGEADSGGKFDLRTRLLMAPSSVEVGVTYEGRTWPGPAVPVSMETCYDEPGYDEPGYDQPGYDEPGYDQPGYDQPGYEEPGYEEPEPPSTPGQGAGNGKGKAKGRSR
jgi:hypothetical protein